MKVKWTIRSTGRSATPGAMRKDGDPMQFQIENMTCGGCVRGVTRAIQAVDPKAEVDADLATHEVKVTSQAPRDQLMSALAEAGYDAR